jgi:hypothetical protein
VREAIVELGIRHGVRAIEDPAVLKLPANFGVMFDLLLEGGRATNLSLRADHDLFRHFCEMSPEPIGGCVRIEP